MKTGSASAGVAGLSPRGENAACCCSGEGDASVTSMLREPPAGGLAGSRWSSSGKLVMGVLSSSYGGRRLRLEFFAA
ncbi:MAG: hypothetical protein WCA89_01150, partial [Terracidiphilus sp.]